MKVGTHARLQWPLHPLRLITFALFPVIVDGIPYNMRIANKKQQPKQQKKSNIHADFQAL